MKLKKLITSITGAGDEEPKAYQKCEKCNGGGMIYDKKMAECTKNQVRDFYYECSKCGGDGFIFASMKQLMNYMKTYT